ncbi:MAG TPA: hypothetical protein VGW78_06825 [Candidatus Babeliales bacterium]|nr:hypothetical protein [Candidatus Babeliales bacterium]
MMHINAILGQRIKVDIKPKGDVWYSFCIDFPNETDKMSTTKIHESQGYFPIISKPVYRKTQFTKYQNLENAITSIAQEESQKNVIILTKKLTPDLPASWQNLYNLLQPYTSVNWIDWRPGIPNSYIKEWRSVLPENIPLYTEDILPITPPPLGITPACQCTIDWKDYNANKQRFGTLVINVSSIDNHPLGKVNISETIYDVLYYQCSKRETSTYTDRVTFGWALAYNAPRNENIPVPENLLDGTAPSPNVYVQSDLTPQETENIETCCQNLIKYNFNGTIPEHATFTHTIETKEDRDWIYFYNISIRMINRRSFAYDFDNADKAVQLFDIQPTMTQEELTIRQAEEKKKEEQEKILKEQKLNEILPPTSQPENISSKSTSQTKSKPQPSSWNIWQKLHQWRTHYASPLTNYLHTWWQKPISYRNVIFGGLTVSGLGYLYWKYAGKHK